MALSKILAGKVLAILLSAVLSNAASAMEPRMATNKSTSLTQSYVWYDGDREHQVWLNPQMVAEFNPSSEGEKAMQSISSTAKIASTQHQQAGVRFWRLENTTATATRSISANHPQGKYSVVMHDAPTSTGRMRALPGNIIVYLNPQWDAAAVSNWLKTRKLEIVKKLEIGPNIYVIKTGPGMEALTTANTLYRSGEVKAAFPDWWQEVAPR